MSLPKPAPRVLIVDDTNSLRSLLCTLLRHEGMNVIGDLGCGRSVLTCVERSQPDIVCLDYDLPDTDGLTLLKQVHAAHPDVAVVMITGSGGASLRAEAAEAGAAGFISKPFSQSQVIDELRHVLHAQRLLNSIDLPQALDSPLQGKQVVIADDSAVQRRLLLAILAESGMRVVGEADNGQTAVDLCATQRPDLACLDIEMPVMNGLEALQRIHPALPELPIMMITGHADRSSVQQAAQYGARGYILKPYQPANVVKALERLFA